MTTTVCALRNEKSTGQKTFKKKKKIRTPSGIYIAGTEMDI